MLTYLDTNIDMALTTYDSGNMCLELFVADTKHNAQHDDDFMPGEPWATLSVDIPGYQFGMNEIALELYRCPDFVLDLLRANLFLVVTGKNVHHAGLDYPLVLVKTDKSTRLAGLDYPVVAWSG